MKTVIILDPIRREKAMRSPESRRLKNQLFVWFCVATAFVSVVVLVVLLGAIVKQGVSHFSLAFLTSPPSPDANRAGIAPALWGTVFVCLVCALTTLPIGVATAVFLHEYRPKNRYARWFHHFVQINITNLAGVPSVVYGIIGLTAFVGMFGLLGNPMHPAWEIGVDYFDQYLAESTEEEVVLLVPVDRSDSPPSALETGMIVQTPRGAELELNVIGARDPLPADQEMRKRTLRADAEGGRISKKSWYYIRMPFGRSVLAAGLTLMLVVLPVLIISTQEALTAVPNSLRDGAFGLGATQWQTIKRVTLPAAIPGIMTGSIIAMSRAIGEAAPILMIAGIVYISSAPESLMDDFTVMPLQIYNWAQRPQQEFHEVAATGIIVLLAVLLAFNAVAVFLRQRLAKPLS
jgi:phosphate transport system permease protein